MIELAADDPRATLMLERALNVVREVAQLHDKFLKAGKRALPADCELMRLISALPTAPLDLGAVVTVGLGNARGALTHIAAVLTSAIPVAPIVLQALLRAALVGAGRPSMSSRPMILVCD